MTVCVAVGCDCVEGKNPKIIFVSDFLLSMGYTSAEIALKIRKLGKRWNIMFAGDDISHVGEVVENAQSKLNGQERIGGFQAANAVSESYHLVRRKQIENRILRSYDMTMKQFLETGKNAFPESHHLNMIYEIERYDLGCQFLAAGFMSDDSDLPCFFTVSNPGEFFPLDDIGYCAIGSGRTNAISYLARRNQSIYETYERSLYNAIVAKHLAEKALGVGEETCVIVQERGGTSDSVWLETQQVEAINKIWKDEEENARPANLEVRLRHILGIKD